jgi:hypothetical protein
MFIFKVDVQSIYLETKCSWVKLSQGINVTVDISSGSKCHGERNVGGRNIKAPSRWHLHFLVMTQVTLSPNLEYLMFVPGGTDTLH